PTPSPPQPYFRRHLVCQTHAILPLVVLEGVEMRFCQQCAKFERLTAFDLSNRSCRLRLSRRMIAKQRAQMAKHAARSEQQPHSQSPEEPLLHPLSLSLGLLQQQSDFPFTTAAAAAGAQQHQLLQRAAQGEGGGRGGGGSEEWLPGSAGSPQGSGSGLDGVSALGSGASGPQPALAVQRSRERERDPEPEAMFKREADRGTASPDVGRPTSGAVQHTSSAAAAATAAAAGGRWDEGSRGGGSGGRASGGGAPPPS
ncbi:Squamosa promoter-binding-like protein 7, partial [Tetrabaena socialis]